MKSLFIVSLPRSLSTVTFRACRDALGLEAPSWVANGEVLNHDLHLLGRWPKLMDEGHKYIARENDAVRFEQAGDFLETVAKTEGYIYKDVVNLFVLAEWLSSRDFRVLKIKRDLAEVGYAALHRGWYFPAQAASGKSSLRTRAGSSLANHYAWAVLARRALRTRTHARATAALLQDDVLRGLLRAERVLDELPGLTVEYADLINDETVLRSALQQLYPEVEIPNLDYIDEKFRQKRLLRADRKLSNRFRRIQRRIERLRMEAAPVSEPPDKAFAAPKHP